MQPTIIRFSIDVLGELTDESGVLFDLAENTIHLEKQFQILIFWKLIGY